MRWEHAETVSPRLERPVPVVVARDLPYLPGANRFQNISLYLPATARTSDLVGSPVEALPGADRPSDLPSYQVHVHGGAWRDPELGSTSIEPAVAHAFSAVGPAAPLLAVASVNYSLSQFPTHPALPYDAVADHHGLGHLPQAPRPAALLGMNGLYDLPALVDGLDPSHAHLREDHQTLLSFAFGADQGGWSAASWALFDPAEVADRVRAGPAP